MRVDNITYDDFRRGEAKDVRYVISVNFGDDVTPRMHYFTSHADCDLPASATSISYDVIESISGQAQRLDLLRARSDIGGVRFSVIDPQGAVTSVIANQLAAGYGLRHKQVVIYLGGKDFAWADYVVAATVIIDNREWRDGLHTFSCSDILRTTRKNIFDLRTTTLRNSITQDDTVLPVYSTADFEHNTHGPSYSDAPNQRVIYVDVEEETVRTTDKVDTPISVTGTDISTSATDNSINSTTTDLSVFAQGQQIVLSGTNDGIYHIIQPPTATKIIVAEALTTTAAGNSINVLADIQFYNCTRGALNTKPAAHEVDATADADRRTKVKERVYIELPLLKVVYAILTNQIYGQADPWPSNWGLGISTKWVATSTFTEHPDWWDTTDDTKGQIVRFEGPKKRDGKKFIEEQLMRLQGAFLRVQADGQLGLRRKVRVSPQAAYVELIGDDNLVEWGSLKEDMNAVHNAFTIHWNADRRTGKPTRHLTLYDPDSYTIHGKAKPLEMTFDGLSGYTTTQATLSLLRDSARDMYAGPPLLARVKALPSINNLEVGDVVRWRTSQVRDPVDGGTLDRSFIVTAVRNDWASGDVVLDLFGSSQEAKPINDASTSSILPDSAYQVGTEIRAYLDAKYTNANGTVYTVTNGTLHIIDDVTFDGAADLSTGAGNYYYLGDITFDRTDAGGAVITVTVTQNVRFRAAGFITVNSDVDGVGKGLPGGIAGATSYDGTADGVAGLVGSTRAGGGIKIDGLDKELVTSTVAGGVNPFDGYYYGGGQQVAGKYDVVPFFALNIGASLGGLPSDLRGSSGAAGADVIQHSPDTRLVVGGSGGNGGAGLSFVCRGISAGASTTINLSGGDGQPGGQYVSSINTRFEAGNGAGGYPGVLHIVLDGNTAIETSIREAFVADIGASPVSGDRLTNSWVNRIFAGDTTLYRSYNEPFLAESKSDANLRIQYVPTNDAPSPDAPDLPDRPLSINVQEQLSTKRGLNWAGLEISVNPPTDPTYAHARIRVAKSGTDSWADVGIAYGTQELVHLVPADGSTYQIRAYAINLEGKQSHEYVTATHTVTAAAGSAVIGTGNEIKTSDTVGQASNGQGIIVKTESISGYSPSGVEKTRIDAATGKITATDVNLSGNITALAGAIGGWSISGGSLISGGVDIDSNNQRIKIANGGNWIETSVAAGYRAYNSTLGITVDIPIDGSAPTFASGVLKEMAYEIYTSGVIKTDPDPASNGGTLIDTGGIQLFNPSGVRTIFLDSINSNHEITGKITITAGSSGINNFDDAGALAGQDVVDWKLQVAGASKPEDNATFGATWGVDLFNKPADVDLLNQYAAVADYDKYLGVELSAGQSTSERVDFRVTNNTGTNNIWYKVVEWSPTAHHDGIGIAGLFQHGRTDRPTYLQLINFGFNVGILPAVGYVNFQKQMEPDGWAQMRVYQDSDASGNPRITVYFVVRVYSSAICSFDIFRKQVGATKIWQRGLSLGAGYTPAGTEIPYKLNRGVQDNADITSLNTAADTAAVNGRAAADVEADAAAGATYTGDTVGVQGGLLPNWACNIVAPDGKPAGIRGVENTADQAGIAFGDSSKTWIRLSHATDATIAYGWPAIPIDDKQQYRITIRHRADVQDTAGLFLRMNERNNALPSGKTHVGYGGESVTAGRTSIRDLQFNGPFPPMTWTESTFTYTPTLGVQWASFSLYNWRGSTINYDVDAVMITPVAKTADQIDESGGRKWAGESGADRTKTVIETGLAVTAGAITYGTNIVLDFFNKFIGIGTAYWNTSIANISLDHNNGQPRAYIGDGDESYLLIDSSTGIAECGEKMIFSGTDSYHNNAFYERTYFDVATVAPITGNVSYGENGILLTASSSVPQSTYSRRRKNTRLGLNWTNPRRYNFMLVTDATSFRNMAKSYIVTGRVGGVCIGFRLERTATAYEMRGYMNDGTTGQVTTQTIYPVYSSLCECVIEVTNKQGGSSGWVDVTVSYFADNGYSLGSLSMRIPDASVDADRVLQVELNYGSLGDITDPSFTLSQFTFLQR